MESNKTRTRLGQVFFYVLLLSADYLYLQDTTGYKRGSSNYPTVTVLNALRSCARGSIASSSFLKCQCHSSYNLT